MFENKFAKVHAHERELFRAYLKTYGNFQKPRHIKISILHEIVYAFFVWLHFKQKIY